MGRKSKAQKTQERNNVIGGILTAILMGIILVCGILKQGTVGYLSDNLLTYLFGKFYAVLLVSIIILNIAKALNHKFSIRFMIGLVMFNLSFLFMASIVNPSEITTFKELIAYVPVGFMAVFKNTGVIGAGVIGTCLYNLLLLLVDKTITIVLAVTALIASVLLMIPNEWYKDMAASLKEQKEERKKQAEFERQERKRKEEERRIEEARKEEERKLRLAMEMNSAPEVEVEEVKEEPVIVYNKPVERLEPVRQSKYFINVDENTEKPKVVEESAFVEPEKEEPISQVDPVTHRINTTKVGAYHYPPMNLLEPKSNSKASNLNKTAAQIKGEKVIEILKNFEIDASLINTYIGPSVTKFEIKPESTVKVNRIMNIQDNIKMELAARDIRIEAPIPGRSAVGIEIPNAEVVAVKMQELIQGLPKKEFNTKFALGKDLLGNNVYCDLAKMPHLLIAGATGSGKSVCINSIITSILMKSHPDEVKLVLVDPKKVEFTPYRDIPHLLWPIIDDAKMASMMLEKIVVIMEQRYELFSKAGVRNIATYNQKVEENNANPDNEKMEKVPFIIVIIDELADLMACAKKDVELSIQRITQLARASGIHLVVATQRPSVDIITGVIKSNIPSRISFAVASAIDSKTVLDQSGAERLLGHGDMLYYPTGETSPIRLQGVYVTDEEIQAVTAYAKKFAQPKYDDTYFSILNNNNGTGTASAVGDVSEDDPLYPEVVEYVKSSQKASTSLLQRRFGIGFNRAARIIDKLEEKGVIGPAQGSKPREVYIKPEE